MAFKRIGKSQRRRRRLWRRLCLPFLTVVLILLGILLYAQMLGLPQFVKEPIFRQLQLPGWTVDVGRLYLAPLSGVEAEGIELRRQVDGQQVRISTDRVILGIDPTSLWHWEPKINALRVSGGDIRCPVPDKRTPSTSLHLENIATDVDLVRGGVSRIHYFRARALGAQLEIEGTVTNALAMTDWDLWQPSAKDRAPDWHRIGDWVRRLQALDLDSASKIRLEWHGDAKSPSASRGRLRMTLPQTRGRWGSLADTQATVRLHPASKAETENRIELDVRTAQGTVRGTRWQAMEWTGTAAIDMPLGAASPVKSRLSVADFRLPWVTVDELTLSSDSIAEPNPEDAGKQAPQGSARTHLKGTASGIEVGGEVADGVAQSARLDLELTHRTGLREWVPPALEKLQGKALLDQARFRADDRPGTVDSVAVDISGSPLEGGGEAAGLDDMAPVWRRLARYHLEANVDVTGVAYPNLSVDTLVASLDWRAPRVTLKSLRGELYDRTIAMAGLFNVDSNGVSLQSDFDFDLHRIAPLLPKDVRRDLEKFTWESPPEFHANAESLIPPWPSAPEKWAKSLVANTRIEGRLRSGPGSFEGIPFSGARSHFRFSEFRWHLPDLVVKRPEGRLDIDYQCDTEADHYALQADGQIFAGALQPLFNGKADDLFAPLEENRPAEISGMVYGPFDEGKGGIDGRITLPDVRYRGESWQRAGARINYTNKLARLSRVLFERDDRSLRAKRIDWDLNASRFQFSDVRGRVSPHSVARMVNTNLHQQLRPFRFSSPPKIDLEGSVQVREEGAVPDLQMSVDADDLSTWRLDLTNTSGEFHWKGDELTVNRFVSDFYGGEARGNGHFSFAPTNHIDFRFDLGVDTADLTAIMEDVKPGKKQLEGELTTDVTVTSAGSDSWRSWHGYGNVRLKDGLVWDIPIFGVLSTPLNKISPGLGNSRADRATASFTLENGVIHTQDLEIRGPAFGLNYRGKLDLQGSVDARAKAVLLEDMVVVGPLFNLAITPLTELFVYHITGTLEEPAAEPLYVFPKLMLLPFKPFQEMQKLLPSR